MWGFGVIRGIDEREFFEEGLIDLIVVGYKDVFVESGWGLERREKGERKKFEIIFCVYILLNGSMILLCIEIWKFRKRWWVWFESVWLLECLYVNDL